MKNRWIQKKLMIGLLTLALTASLVAGCSSTSTATDSTTTTTTVEEDMTKEAQSDTQIVKVTSVDGNTVTAVIGTLETSEGGGTFPSGEAPDGTEMPSNDAQSKEKPSDDAASKEKPSGEAPGKDTASGSESSTETMPEGGTEMPGGTPGGMPGGGSTFVEGADTITFTLSDSTAITLEYQQGSTEGTTEDIVENAVLEIALDDSSIATTVLVKNLQAGGGFGGSDEVTNGTSANTIEEDTEVSSNTYESTGDDENGLRVDGSTVSLSDVIINKTAGESSNTENGDFYGQNAGFLALNGANVTITNATVNTSVTNGNGVFSYGEGTTVNISDSTIRTTGNNSGGIQTTGGGTTIANNLDVETKGDSAASIRSDRGGGTVTVNGGNYLTDGIGSPAVYSTAAISVDNATLTANHSEAVVVEGQNSIALTNVNLSGNMDGSDSSENLQAVMIYQSMSGDAQVGQAAFSMTGGSLTSLSGDLFYVTNTSTTINLSQVALTTANDVLFHIAGNTSVNGWGTQGANGGDVVLTTDEQTMEGIITVDEISSLNLSMSNESVFKGTINSEGVAGEVALTMDDTSTWTLTGDSYISSFTGDMSQINVNGHVLYVDGEAITE